MSFWLSGIVPLGLVLIIASVLYIRRNDSALTTTPQEALAFSPKRCSEDNVRFIASGFDEKPISILDQLPPQTGRRYIVVGGSGFLGGWLVVHLLRRGEHPRNIRILDIRAPTRHDLTSGSAKDVAFFKVDVSDTEAVDAAFKAPWPVVDDGHAHPEISVFHTAANIRFYERHESLVPNSAKVNVQGTQNVVNSARAIGATALVYTSSGSVAVRSSRVWLWPWEKEPKFFVQAINDDTPVPNRHQDFFSNYAATKIRAERIVREADGSSIDGDSKVIRTGCVRPGNGVYGPGGDMLCGAYLVRKANPSWIHSTMQSFVYVENCSLAHLLYEKRLLEIMQGTSNPDIGGQAFIVTDPGPPATYGDVYVTLGTLTNGETYFPYFSPTLMLFISHLIEIYYLTRHRLVGSSSAAAQAIATLMPPINGDIVNLQPSLFTLTMAHVIFDDYRARLPPAKGGLGYKGAWNTMQGLHETVKEYKKGLSSLDERANVAGVSFGFGLVKAEKGVKDVNDKVISGLGLDPVQVMN